MLLAGIRANGINRLWLSLLTEGLDGGWTKRDGLNHTNYASMNICSISPYHLAQEGRESSELIATEPLIHPWLSSKPDCCRLMLLQPFCQAPPGDYRGLNVWSGCYSAVRTSSFCVGW